MAIVGYARVSSTDQDLTVQLDALRGAGCEKIFDEKMSGRTQERTAWKECRAYLREGDVLVFTRLDRLGRSVQDLIDIEADLRHRGVTLRCLQQGIDTGTIEGRLLWGILAAVAEFEIELKRERQKEGIKRAKDAGIKIGGRKRKADETKIRRLRAQGLNAKAIAEALGCARSNVYRAVPDGWGEPVARKD